MTGALATRPQLTKLAILYGEHGYTDRAERLAHARIEANRPELTSSAELTRAEAHALIELLEETRARKPAAQPLQRPAEPVPDDVPVPAPAADPAEDVVLRPGEIRGVGNTVAVKRHDPGCGPDGRHHVPIDPSTVTRCPCGAVTRVPRVTGACLKTCYCGHCPHYEPPPLPNWRGAAAELIEKKNRGRR